MPRSSVVLSAGCSGSWYFEWFRQCFGDSIRIHIGVEAYSPKPDRLPPEVRWINNPVFDMRDVHTGDVDLVFAGQTVEHLWPEELTGFLLESHRVLRRDGIIVLDSPNREITWPLNWYHPEHTMELTVPEIQELMLLAGFRVLSLRGIWLCREGGVMLPLEPLSAPSKSQSRLDAAPDNPMDSFVWWLEAVRENRQPEREALRKRISQIFQSTRSHDLQRCFHGIGKMTRNGSIQQIDAPIGLPGHLAYGPYAPFQPGSYRAEFSICSTVRSRSPDLACILDISEDTGQNAIVSYRVRCADVQDQWEKWHLDFRFNTVRFGIECRLFSTGSIPISLQVPISICEV